MYPTERTPLSPRYVGGASVRGSSKKQPFPKQRRAAPYQILLICELDKKIP